MGYTSDWKITGLRKQNTNSLSGVIIGTNWTVTLTDEDGNSGIFYGATPFDLKTVDPNNFVEYENLTESQVLDWVKNEVSGSNQYPGGSWKHIESTIQEQINAKKYHKVVVEERNLPWAPPIPTPPTGSGSTGEQLPPADIASPPAP